MTGVATLQNGVSKFEILQSLTHAPESQLITLRDTVLVETESKIRIPAAPLAIFMAAPSRTEAARSPSQDEEYRVSLA